MTVIEKPIFFIGFPRSGTTITFESFARNIELGWPTNYSTRFPKYPILNFIRNLHDNRLINITSAKRQNTQTSKWGKLLARPDEAYPFWERYTDIDFSFDYLIDVEASDKEKKSVSKAVKSILLYQGRKRFSAKLTGPPRITYLKSIFPDAYFIHVIRDPRAVINSSLKVGFWKNKSGYDRPFWKNGFPEEYQSIWLDSGKDPAILVALQWKYILELARRESENLKRDKYLEIRYEDYIESPHDTLNLLQDFCMLEHSDRSHQYIDEVQKLKNMNYKYLTEFSSENINKINSLLSPFIDEFGYDRNQN